MKHIFLYSSIIFLVLAAAYSATIGTRAYKLTLNYGPRIQETERRLDVRDAVAKVQIPRLDEIIMLARYHDRQMQQVITEQKLIKAKLNSLAAKKK